MNGHGPIVRASPLHDREHPTGAGAAVFAFQSGGILMGYYFASWGAIVAATYDPEGGPDARSSFTLVSPWKHEREPNDGDVIDAFLDAQASGMLDTATMILLGPPHPAE